MDIIALWDTIEDKINWTEKRLSENESPPVKELQRLSLSFHVMSALDTFTKRWRRQKQTFTAFELSNCCTSVKPSFKVFLFNHRHQQSVFVTQHSKNVHPCHLTLYLLISNSGVGQTASLFQSNMDCLYKKLIKLQFSKMSPSASRWKADTRSPKKILLHQILLI